MILEIIVPVIHLPQQHRLAGRKWDTLSYTIWYVVISACVMYLTYILLIIYNLYLQANGSDIKDKIKIFYSYYYQDNNTKAYERT